MTILLVFSTKTKINCFFLIFLVIVNTNCTYFQLGTYLCKTTYFAFINDLDQ